jgi:carbonic anhydrase/acetyltransferase-like protein (isoleucine patch superfamily)
VLLSDHDVFRTFLDSGAAWGCAFRYHEAENPAQGYEIVGMLLENRSLDETVVLGRADRLVAAALDLGGASDRPPVTLFGSFAKEPDGSGWDWSGWGILCGAPWRTPPLTDERQLETSLASSRGCVRIESPVPLRLDTANDYMAANRQVLRGFDPTPPPSRREWPDGVRVSPGAWVHPTAQLVAPVSIAAGSEIGARAVVGPHVVVGTDCFVDRESVVTNSVVLPHTYVAECARLDSVLADQNRIVAFTPQGPVLVSGTTAVASMTDHLPARITAAAMTLKRRVASGLSWLRGVERDARKTVSARLNTKPTADPAPDPRPAG